MENTLLRYLFGKGMGLRKTQSATARFQYSKVAQKRLTYGCYQNVLKKAFLVLRDIGEPSIEEVSEKF